MRVYATIAVLGILDRWGPRQLPPGLEALSHPIVIAIAAALAFALLGGTVALSAHGLKAGTRLAVNASPEPVSNWILSFGEDAATVGLLWMAASHPILSLLVAAAVVIAAVLSIHWMLRTPRRLVSPRRVPGT